MPRPRARVSVLAALVPAVTMLALVGCTGGSSGGSTSSAPSIETITLPADTVGPSSSSASSSSASSSSSSATHGPRTATVLGSGDVLVHPPLWMQAHRDAGGHGYDFGPIYASVKPDVESADLATCELETPLAPPDGPFVGYPNFSAPPQVLTALTGIGYRSCTTASNHSLDGGASAVTRTLDELDAAGLRHTGSYRSAKAASTPLIITLPNGVRVGQLAYTFGFNGISLPADKPWLANEIDVPAILAAARRAKAAGADIVVLSMHWGTEYDHLATQEQRDQAARLLRSPDIDLILGDHAHVIQPAQRIHGKWVFYCMGNQIARHDDPIPDNREGIMPRVTFVETSAHHFRVQTAEAIPTWMQLSPDLRLIDLPRALASSGLSSAQRETYRTAQAAIASYLDGYGAVTDGLHVR